MARLKELYKSKVVGELTKEFGYKNRMAVPRLERIVVSMGVGKAAQDKKFVELAKADLTLTSSRTTRHRTSHRSCCRPFNTKTSTALCVCSTPTGCISIGK